jgi:hypothetical protein
MNFRNKLAVMTTVLLAFCTSAFGADTSGKILGTVKDPAGNLIPHAAATLTNKATGVKQTTQADDQGAFAFPVIPVGAYELVVSIENFRPYTKSDIAIDLGSAVQFEVRLELAVVNESVTVTEDATQVETSDTKLGQVIGSKQVTGLPLNGRSYTDLLSPFRAASRRLRPAAPATELQEAASVLCRSPETVTPDSFRSTDNASRPTDST